ncbi:MAG: DUF2339 domain-containing protein [Hyphomicrobiales bacterium]
MTGMFDLDALVLLVLLIPIATVVAFGLAIVNFRRVRALEARVAGLEAGMRAAPLAVPDSPAADERPSTAPHEEVAATPAATPAVPPPLPASASRRPAPVAAPAVPPPPARDIEETIGSRLTVWIGGIALALGGIFLVRYAIERDLVGPEMRIAFGALFAAGLLGVGEWLRRNGQRLELPVLPQADIPAVLTAAGTIAAFATTYAAYALYGFIGPAIAFVLLGLIAVATMVLAALHAPWIAAIGLVGAYATPVLVSTDQPQAWALFIYLGFVTLAAFWLARARRWRWLAIAAGIAAIAWGLVYSADVSAPQFEMLPTSLYAIALALLILAFLVRDVHRDAVPDIETPIDWLPVGMAGGIAAFALTAASADEFGAMSLVLALALSGLVLGGAWRWPPFAAAAGFAGLAVVLGYEGWGWTLALAGPPETLVPELAGIPRLHNDDFAIFMGVGLLLAGGYAAVSVLAAFRSIANGLRLPSHWAALAGALPIAMLVIAYGHVEGFERSIPFALFALGITAVALVLLDAAWRREPEVHHDAFLTTTAAFAATAVGAFALALTIALEKGFLTIGLALASAGLAFAAGQRPVRAFAPLAGLLGAAVLGRMLWDPAIVGTDLGATPFLNWITYGYGVPAAAFAYAAWTFGRIRRDLFARVLEALAVVFVALFVVMEIRHVMTGGDIFGPEPGLAEQGTYTIAALLLAVGVGRLSRATGSPVFSVATLLLGLVGFAVAAVALLLVENPYIRGTAVGEGHIFNDLLLGYLLPAGAAAWLAVASRETRPRWYVAAAGGLSLALAFAWTTLTVRHFFQGDHLGSGWPTGDAERYAYSLAWLVFAVVLLAAGIISRSRAVRAASGLVMVITVAKVFLVDMAGLTGVWRALSFIGLGVVLIGIGALYQRLLASHGNPPAGRAGGGTPPDLPPERPAASQEN